MLFYSLSSLKALASKEKHISKARLFGFEVFKTITFLLHTKNENDNQKIFIKKKQEIFQENDLKVELQENNNFLMERRKLYFIQKTKNIADIVIGLNKEKLEIVSISMCAGFG